MIWTTIFAFVLLLFLNHLACSCKFLFIKLLCQSDWLLFPYIRQFFVRMSNWSLIASFSTTPPFSEQTLFSKPLSIYSKPYFWLPRNFAFHFTISSPSIWEFLFSNQPYLWPSIALSPFQLSLLTAHAQPVPSPPLNLLLFFPVD